MMGKVPSSYLEQLISALQSRERTRDVTVKNLQRDSDEMEQIVADFYQMLSELKIQVTSLEDVIYEKKSKGGLESEKHCH